MGGVVIALFLPAVPKPYFSVIMATDDKVLGTHNITTERQNLNGLYACEWYREREIWNYWSELICWAIYWRQMWKVLIVNAWEICSIFLHTRCSLEVPYLHGPVRTSRDHLPLTVFKFGCCHFTRMTRQCNLQQHQTYLLMRESLETCQEHVHGQN